jgi:hypothetical protein
VFGPCDWAAYPTAATRLRRWSDCAS